VVDGTGPSTAVRHWQNPALVTEVTISP
jgi:hypothetical protein